MNRYFIIALHGPNFSGYWAEKPKLVLMDEATRYESLKDADDALTLVPPFAIQDPEGNDVELIPEILVVQTS